MTQVTIHEAKTHLSRLIRRVLEGEEIVIARGKTPLVMIKPLDSHQRIIGGASGLIKKMDNSFFDPLEDFSEYMG